MGTHTESSQIPFKDSRNGSHGTRPSNGRTSGPTRRSTKGQWTSEEDEVLRIAVHRFQGKNWKKIAECFKDRTDVQCLHRWQKVLNPELVKGPWSKEEDNLITELVKRYGAKKWSTIAQHLPGRIGKQCRERWHNHLNPNIIKEAWTQTEELVLIRAHQVYGNKWAELTKFLPGRSDNAIKNHWNSSVKKKLDMYLASGLLSKFEISHLICHQDQSAASSSSKAQKSDDSFVRPEGLPECSQYTGAICLPQSKDAAITHPREKCKVAEESSPPLCSEYHYAGVEKAAITIPQEQSEGGDKSLEPDLSLGSETFSWEDLQVDPNELSDMPLFGIGGVPRLTLASLAPSDYCEVIPSQKTPDAEGNTDSLHNSTTVQLQEKLVSQSCYVPPDALGTAFLHSSANASLVVNKNLHGQFGYSSPENAETSVARSTHDGFICSQGSNCSSPDDEFYKIKNLPRLVPANDFVLDPSNDSQSSPSKEADIEGDEQEAGILCCEPSRFPTLDVPFFNCDLTKSGSDMHQDYSPFGIRQLLMSSMTPLNIWDSPSRDDSPEALLRSAAKICSSTPSVLKKRHRELVSPLSEKREEKKLEGPSMQEPISCLTNNFSRLNMKFCEVVSKEGQLSASPKMRNMEASCAGKENMLPSCLQTDEESRKSLLISESSTSSKELKGIEFLNKTSNAAIIDLRNAVKNANDYAGVHVEHQVSYLHTSSDQNGIKNDREIGISPSQPANGGCRRLGSASKPLLLSSAENARLSAGCSPFTGTRMGDANFHLGTCPGQKVESTCAATFTESNGIYIDTPLKRSLESPSAWKSPWFLSTFSHGPKIYGDATFEDIGYCLAGDCSYGTLGLMKRLEEHAAATCTDVQEALTVDTPDKTLKEKCNEHRNKEESPSQSSQMQQIPPCPPSTFMVERRVLDFSECSSPEIRKASFTS